jgi:hypothetical protein
LLDGGERNVERVNFGLEEWQQGRIRVVVPRLEYRCCAARECVMQGDEVSL